MFTQELPAPKVPRCRSVPAAGQAAQRPELQRRYRQAGARNSSNFYDSQREGLLAFDGPPCFYLVPRTALHAVLPAPRLYYTLIAYADPRDAPAVTMDACLHGSVGLMFGTPAGLLLHVEPAPAPPPPQQQRAYQQRRKRQARDADHHLVHRSTSAAAR